MIHNTLHVRSNDHFAFHLSHDFSSTMIFRNPFKTMTYSYLVPLRAFSTTSHSLLTCVVPFGSSWSRFSYILTLYLSVLRPAPPILPPARCLCVYRKSMVLKDRALKDTDQTLFSSMPPTTTPFDPSLLRYNKHTHCPALLFTVSLVVYKPIKLESYPS